MARHNNEDSSPADKTESISFRIPKQNLDQLRKLANENRISINVLANQIFTSYLDWTLNAPKAGMLPIAKVLFMDLLEGYSEEHIRKVGKELSKKILFDLTIALRNRYDLESVIGILESLYRNAGPGFVFKQTVEPGTGNHKIIIQHELGKKYSQLMIGFLQATFEMFGMRTLDSFATEKSVVMTIAGNTNHR